MGAGRHTIFSAGPTIGPDRPDTIMWEEKRNGSGVEVEGEGLCRGSGRVRMVGTGILDDDHGNRYAICALPLLYSFSSVLFFSFSSFFCFLSSSTSVDRDRSSSERI